MTFEKFVFILLSMPYNQSELFNILSKSEIYNHKTNKITVRETHISMIFLTGEYAYKFKKSLKLDFLDFTTLEKRKIACQNELKLNQRYAKEIYLDVIPVYQNKNHFNFSGDGKIVEYAVKMKQFDENYLLDNLLSSNNLKKNDLYKLTEEIARFHYKAELKSQYWNLKDIKELALDNFSACLNFIPPLDKEILVNLKIITEKLINENSALINNRQKTHVKSLHGDMHLGNICLYKGEPKLFDGIEFNLKYSCCDTIADLAFLLMDLEVKDHSNFSNLVLNYYLELTDDYNSLALLNLYKSYRAMVRAKIACYKITVDKSSEKEAVKYCNLSNKYLNEKSSCLIAIGGISGSGKSTLAKALSEEINAIIIRQDAVRKNIFKVNLNEKGSKEIYSEEANSTTKQEVIKRIESSILSDMTIIVDTTFCDPNYRLEVENIAKVKGLEFLGIWCETNEKVVKERLKNRSNDISDANYEIYKLQKKSLIKPKNWVTIDTNLEIQKLIKICKNKLEAFLS